MHFRLKNCVCFVYPVLQLLLWIQNNFTADIFSLPTAMTCPGSQAAEFFACFSRPDIRGEHPDYKTMVPAQAPAYTVLLGIIHP
jgi:hypothetical protein